MTEDSKKRHTDENKGQKFDTKGLLMGSLIDDKDKGKGRKKGHLVLPTTLIHGIIKSEVNLERLPFFVPTKKEEHPQENISFTRQVEREGVEITVNWNVRPHSEYGLPNSFDRDVYRAIQELINRKGILYGNLIPFTYRELCRIMGIQYSGGKKGTRSDIKRSLRRIRATEIESRGTFRLKGEGEGKDRERWINEVFSIFNTVIEMGERLPDGTIAETNFLELGSWYVESIKRGYLKMLDLQFYRSLELPLARFLYSYLDVVFFPIVQAESGAFRKRYHELCEELLITPQKYKSWAQANLKPAIEELKNARYLADFTLEDIEGIKWDWICVFRPGERYTNPERFDRGQVTFDFMKELTPALNQGVVSDDKPAGRQDRLNKSAELPAHHLVVYFHEKAGRPKHKATKKEISQAQDLIDRHGEDKSRSIVDFAFEEAPKTNYQMKFFGAILHFAEQYQIHLDADFQKREAKKAREEAVRKVKEIKELYAAEVEGKLNAFKNQIGEEGWKGYLEKAKAKLQESNPNLLKFGETVLDRILFQDAKKMVAEELGIPSFENYARDKGIDPALIEELKRKE